MAQLKVKCPSCGCNNGYRILYNGDKVMDYNTEVIRILCPKCNNRYLIKGDN